MSTPLPDSYRSILLKEVAYFKELNVDEQLRFEKRLQDFLNHVFIEAVGTTLVAKDIVLVAASAVIPVFKFNEWHYPNLKTVLIYPNNFDNNLDLLKIYEFQWTAPHRPQVKV